MRPLAGRAIFVLALAATALPASLSAAAPAQWQSPSGNVACSLTTRLKCFIGETRTPPPPKPASCGLDWGSQLSMGVRSRVAYDCYGGVVAYRPPTLPYGSVWRRNGFVCTVGRVGIRCANRRGHGWFLSRERTRVF